MAEVVAPACARMSGLYESLSPGISAGAPVSTSKQGAYKPFILASCALNGGSATDGRSPGGGGGGGGGSCMHSNVRL